MREYYGETLQSSDDLKTSACCTNVAPHPAVIAALQDVPEEIRLRYYGCGRCVGATLLRGPCEALLHKKGVCVAEEGLACAGG